MKEWIFNKYDANDKSLVTRLLHSRGIKTEEEIYEFLHPLETKIIHPKAFCDMEKVVERLSTAIDNGEKIVIHGYLVVQQHGYEAQQFVGLSRVADGYHQIVAVYGS